jgi:uncharacterized cupin superfamily protein
MGTPPKHLLRQRDIEGAEAVHVSHPLNPQSEIFMKRLSDPTGMARVGVNLARIPPGKESFLPHAHTTQEEWVYVLEGAGVALIGEQELEIGPGDFLGFPTDGTVHHLMNRGDRDLVLLQGGERGGIEIGRFPTIGKRLVFLGDGMAHLIPEEAIESRPLTDWLAKTKR